MFSANTRPIHFQLNAKAQNIFLRPKFEANPFLPKNGAVLALSPVVSLFWPSEADFLRLYACERQHGWSSLSLLTSPAIPLPRLSYRRPSLGFLRRASPAAPLGSASSPPAARAAASWETLPLGVPVGWRFAALQNNGAPVPASPAIGTGGRIGEVKRVTKETNVPVKINLDGTGVADSSTGIPFLDHMLDQLASHGLFDVHVRATGDIHIDDHHKNEDVALAIGTDLSGRPHLSFDLQIPTQRVGTYDTQLVEHFFRSLVNTSSMTLHIRQLVGKDSHHIIEATFKAFGRALRQATEYDLRRQGTIPRFWKSGKSSWDI
ncbi:imidazoleglycerol-phosphate dehydratase 3, chloroplastic-like [Syzygium oleosum]|uniref:imidazoleglycerol-phosphate dehydratase 3, chloroplastic-like n=1 Tax=Syzygium oleosum TaxID=219896 RepID=UPI0024BA4AC5|nr:imidazoleglycerol-phosphate dehydratase 3, chloroplastic-like [Syzygium oleosum]